NKNKKNQKKSSKPKKQTKTAKSRRTIVIAGVPAGLLQDEVMADILTIHFQMSRNNGGDVEEVTYPTQNKGVAYITFEDQAVVERVLRKDQHLLQDKRLSRLYPLSVTRYCQHVSSSLINLILMAVFRGHCVLEDLVEEMKKQSPDLDFGVLQPDGRIAVQGSFPALRALREFLLLKAKSLSEGDSKEGKPHQRPRRKLQEHRGAVEMRNSPEDAARHKQTLLLDTDIYHYMRCFHPKTLQASSADISAVIEGDITTVCIEAAGRRAADHGWRAKRRIEDCSVQLQRMLRKERISLRGLSRAQRERCRQLWQNLTPRYPAVLLIPCDTHVDVVGTPAEVLGK
uniref:RRM domain-containing protein n=1 Tax=Catharus ustulatus TaxID=91951 RepID=A0A8C3U9T1_CATUS